MDFAQEYLDRGSDRLGLQVYPDTREDSPAVVIWPAMGVPARYYRPFATELAAAGLAVVVADLRGTGTSTPAPSRASRYGYAELVDDVAAVQDALKARLNGRRTILLGHSLGGHVCALHLALRSADAGRYADAGVAGLVLVAVGMPYWRTYPGWHRAAILASTRGIAATSALLGVWPGWKFGGRQARGVIRDWSYTARQGRYPVLDGVDTEAGLAAVRTPVLAVSVSDDRYTPRSAADHLCAKFAAAPVERVHYTTGEAGGPLDHFRWVRASAPLAGRVARFADSLPD
ncbi:alpha/beta hydrolase family protein [Planosporangium mesophilum]|nr:alpha/beta fold hydrolase [Planosporangium mesophilum]NJC83473.1 alpha/beta fold hydrolase [Planosporangium mesophilum]